MTSPFVETNLQSVRIPSKNDIIYKDECVLSFDTPDSNEGVYISLSSFLAFGEDYVKLYAEKTKHHVFLHHRRTKKKIEKTEEEGPEKKITRLAIGVDGGFNADAGPKYEYTDHYSIVVLPDGTRVPLDDPSVPPKVRNSADAVIAADSSFKRAELDALNAMWDGELRVASKYADNLVQLANGKKIAASGWTCEHCDLTSNLWLNLTDGAIVCGRRNFDGSGGNNHGVEHFKQTGYPLAVKLGTITQDGRADVFSYPEDDLVLDLHLEKHLAHFGIDIKQLNKTDKSMAELEIDLNQRVGEWITCQESGTILIPAYGPSRTGLVNLGNSCYLNSVAQLIFVVPSFIEAFVDEFPKMVDACDFHNPAQDFLLQMGKLGFGLCSGKYSQPPPEGSKEEAQVGISPRMFMHVAAAGNREFTSKSQQDAQEYLLHLINVLERNLRNKKNPADVFKFRVEDKFQCVESGQVMYKERVEYCLPLPIPNSVVKSLKNRPTNSEVPRPVVPLQDCLDELTQPELVEQFYSSALKRRGQAQRSTKLASFPDFLLVQLKKFGIHNCQAVKLDVAVEMPDVVDLAALKGVGMTADEVALPDEDEPEPELNMDVVTELVAMGVPLDAAKRATFATDNKGLLEAYTWYEEHLGDPDIMAPFSKSRSKVQSNDGAPVDESAISMIVSMGFSRSQALTALRQTDNNLERACDWIFSHPDEPMDATEAVAPVEAPFTDGQPKYRLRAFITHMGTSATVGHYVCHVLQDGQWLIFNDNKVAFSQNPPKELGYLYLYERIAANTS